jgi:hypothetical protein
MAKSNTRKYIIWGSGAVLVGAIAYILWKKYRKPKEDAKSTGVDTTPQSETQTQTNTSSSSSNTPSGPTAAQIDLNNKYRTWANSTPELAKKWGKTSKYDLDATGSYNDYFLKSYNGGGKAEYEAFLKGGNTPGEILLAQNVKSVDRLAKSWGATKSFYQLTGAATGIMANKLERNFVGTNSKGQMRAYKITLYSQASATDKKPTFLLEEWYLDPLKSNQRGNFIGEWRGYWDLTSDGKILSYRVTKGGTTGNTGKASDVANFITGISYAKFGYWI